MIKPQKYTIFINACYNKYVLIKKKNNHFSEFAKIRKHTTDITHVTVPYSKDFEKKKKKNYPDKNRSSYSFVSCFQGQLWTLNFETLNIVKTLLNHMT